MSTVATPTSSLETTVLVSWKTSVAFGVLTALAAALFLGVPQNGEATLRLSPSGDAMQLPDLTVNALTANIVCLVLAAVITIASAALTRAGRRTSLWFVVLFAALLLFGFLVWAAAAGTQSNTIPVPGLLAGALSLSVPLVFGALTGVIGERVGVVNIAIEGQLLAGAFTSAIIASVTGSPWVGVLAAMLAGMLVASVLAVFAIRYFVDQVIVGVVLNVLAQHAAAL